MGPKASKNNIDQRALKKEESAFLENTIEKITLPEEYASHTLLVPSVPYTYSNKIQISKHTRAFKILYHILQTGKIQVIQELPFNQILSQEKEENLKLLFEALGKNKTVIKVQIKENQLNDTHAKYIGEMLEKNNTITSLVMKGNRIGDEGFKYIIQGLMKNRSLEILDMEKNLIGNEGAKEVAVFLRQNSILRTLNLEFNQIETPGLRSLCQSLLRNDALENLYLGWNKIDELGGSILRECILNTTVKNLHVAGNPMSMLSLSLSLSYYLYLLNLKKNWILLL